MTIKIRVFQKKISKNGNFYRIMSISWFNGKLYNSPLNNWLVHSERKENTTHISTLRHYFEYTFKVPFFKRKYAREEIVALRRIVSRYFFVLED